MTITYGYVLIDLLLFLLFYLLQKGALKNPYRVKPIKRYLAALCICLFLVYAFYDPDYIGYWNYCVNQNPYEIAHLEDFYIWLIGFIGGNYFLFRVIVWVGAFILYSLAIKRLKLNFDISFLFLFALELTKFGYGRFILGVAVGFCGLSFIISPIKRAKLLSIILGFGIVFCSAFFHHSIVVNALFIVIAVITPRFSKAGIIITFVSAMLLIPLFYLMGERYIEYVVGLESLSEVNTTLYLEGAKKTGVSLSMFIQHFLERTPFYLTCILFIITHWKNESKDWPKSIQVISNLSFITIVVATVFTIDLQGINLYVFYYRFLYFSIIPMTVFLAYCYEHDIHRKLVRFTYYMGLVATAYILIYRVYMAYTVPFSLQ